MRGNKTVGFTIIELLVVIAIIGIISVILVPTLQGAKTAASDRSAQAFGHLVYKAANAYVASDPSNVAITSTDCRLGYAAGEYSVATANVDLQSCTVSLTSSGFVAVSVVTSSGRVFDFH
ncbi:prepilin-type N-terminal cleavage/methylation domain-containing protein [Deinococcus yavapaiensis]|uniref:Type IV pilus assembly protein PilA n=1 Tax=Deinococcus yavapaiensis KR-236 TaxID=694435 RepID=A0A318S970_9DEIO|nr:prepilin-type N-terminal cleavage/methylation domain-containing protein [Deinococcus yavapaiensis]PYE53571.1 type IV pilus assembly protein PilA [Deinococcus yavapaiensis KR-236]